MDTSFFILIFVSFVVFFFITLLISSYIQKFLMTQNIVRKNFKEETIPTAMGLVYILTISFIYAIFSYISSSALTKPYSILIFFTKDIVTSYPLFIFSALFIGIVGWLDDTQGDKVVKGFSGHFGRLLKHREMTTGALKALGGGFIALYVALMIEGTITERIVNFFIVALMTNWINLLDLRPGRSVKFYLFITIILSFFVVDLETYLIFVAPLLGMVLALFPGDLKAKFMLGDTGANILGVLAGITIVLFATMIFKWFILAFLIGGQIIAETYSVSKIIRQVSLLRMIDEWGRAKEK